MMAGPMAMVGIGASIVGGITGAMGAKVSAQGQQIAIQGQIMQTVAKAFGLQTEAKQYDYSAQVADYQAALASINQKIALSNAAWEAETTSRKAEQEGLMLKQQQGAAVVAEGSSGISLDSTTFGRVRSSMKQLGTYDLATIQADGARKAYAYDVEAMQAGSQADLYRYTSAVNTAQKADALTAAGMVMSAVPLEEESMKLASIGGTLGAISSIATGGASVASKWADAQSKGFV